MRLPRVLRTASFRLAALYLMLFTASAIVLGAVVFWTIRAALDGQAKARVETEIAFLRDEYQAGGLPRLAAAVETRGRGAGALDYLVQGADGRRVAGEIAPVGPRLGWLLLGAVDASGAETESEPELVRALAVPLGDGIVLAVGDDFDRITEAKEAVLRAFAWAVGLTMLLGVAGGAWLSHLFLRRVDAIGRTAEAIIGGDLARRVPVRGTGDDLDRLAATLNRMLDRIAALMESLRQVSNDIAHDLRTPLTRLCQRLDAARTGDARSVAGYERAIEGAVNEAEGLLGTFAALLRIAQVEAGAQRTAFRRVDLSLLVETVAEAFAPAAEDEGHDFSFRVEPGVGVLGDQELLTQMLANLVENALRHTPHDSRIQILLARTSDAGAVLTVQDNGPGVPQAERPRVLQRFFRLEHSRTTPGSGLGLSLVAAVAHLHEARLDLADAGPGLHVTLTFPGPHAAHQARSMR